MKNENGSILILTIVAVLILSVMVAGLLNVGTTELHTTQNYHLSKVAYYTAIQGIEEARKGINKDEGDDDNPDIIGVKGSTISPGLTKYYYTGTLEEMEAGVAELDDPRLPFDGINVKLPGMSLGTSAPATAVLLLINVTAKVNVGRRTAYAELQVGVLDIVSETGY